MCNKRSQEHEKLHFRATVIWTSGRTCFIIWSTGTWWADRWPNYHNTQLKAEYQSTQTKRRLQSVFFSISIRWLDGEKFLIEFFAFSHDGCEMQIFHLQVSPEQRVGRNKNVSVCKHAACFRNALLIATAAAAANLGLAPWFCQFRAAHHAEGLKFWSDQKQSNSSQALVFPWHVDCIRRTRLLSLLVCGKHTVRRAHTHRLGLLHKSSAPRIVYYVTVTGPGSLFGQICLKPCKISQNFFLQKSDFAKNIKIAKTHLAAKRCKRHRPSSFAILHTFWHPWLLPKTRVQLFNAHQP